MVEQPSPRRRPGERERLEARVRELEEALRRAEERLRAHAEALEQATEAFYVIESSLTYRVSARLRAAVDRHAPAGTLRGNLAAGVERGLRLLVVFGPRAFLAHLVKVWVWAPKLFRSDEAREGTARAAPEEGALRAALQGAFRRARDLQRAGGWRAVGAQLLRPGIWVPKLRASLAPRAGTRGRPNEPARPLAFPPSSRPQASVIISAHNQSLYTYNCLLALAENTTGVDYEVIVVDDGSTDDTAEVLGRVENLRVVRLALNQGFVAAANAGASQARADVLVFLDNDTQPQPGWLEALLRSVADPAIGIAGARLIDPDGRLQAAGGVVTREGFACDDGRGDDAEAPLYLYARDVDYCSASCLAVRRAVFEAAGGFDAAYSPASYEDVDLAFKARRLGYRVVYQPEARVVHFEGVSHGRETAHGVRRYQEVHRLKFAERWREALEAHGASLPAGEDGLRRRPAGPRERDRSARGRVLAADYTVPSFDRDAGSLRMYRLLLEMRRLGLAVTFVPHDRTPLEPYTAALQRAGIEVVYGVQDLEAYLESRGRYDVAFLSRPEVAADLMPRLRRLDPALKVVYDTVDLHFLREERRAAVAGDARARRNAERLREMEVALVNGADATVVVSEAEAAVLRELAPDAPVHLVPTVHEPSAEVPGPERREGLLFVGNFQHEPNVDAARFLASEVMPLVRREVPEAVLTIAGDPASSGIGALAGEGVVVTGWVPELAPLLASRKVFVAPLRFGAGTSGKLGESMAAGLPGVTTSLIGEAMGLRDGVEVLVADGAETFAAATVRLYRDAGLWAAVSAAGLDYVRRNLSPDCIRGRLVYLLREVGLDLEAAPAPATSGP